MKIYHDATRGGDESSRLHHDSRKSLEQESENKEEREGDEDRELLSATHIAPCGSISEVSFSRALLGGIEMEVDLLTR